MNAHLHRIHPPLCGNVERIALEVVVVAWGVGPDMCVDMESSHLSVAVGAGQQQSASIVIGVAISLDRDEI